LGNTRENNVFNGEERIKQNKCEVARGFIALALEELDFFKIIYKHLVRTSQDPLQRPAS
jgi:hypothetical protein